MDIDTQSNVTPLPVNAPAGAVSSPTNEKPLPIGTVVASTSPKVEDVAAQQQEIDIAVSSINAFVQNQQRTIRFSVDEQSGRDVVKVVDQLTDELIRQIPSEEVLAISRRLAEQSDDLLNLFSSQA